MDATRNNKKGRETMEKAIFFRGGFVKGMKDIQDSTLSNLDSHPDDYTRGYNAAKLHFSGVVNGLTREADLTGITDEYSGFYGQSKFAHPKP
jgi:hypothetical protein